mmetsp:Transcript_6833/g.17684  ORF Transcript_6833/g.17684 Transcript_6833/m.17684 type:complete len:279 (+) Transcript_6833:139-975(+)
MIALSPRFLVLVLLPLAASQATCSCAFKPEDTQGECIRSTGNVDGNSNPLCASANCGAHYECADAGPETCTLTSAVGDVLEPLEAITPGEFPCSIESRPIQRAELQPRVPTIDNVDESFTSFGSSNINPSQYKGFLFDITAPYTITSATFFLRNFDAADAAIGVIGIYEWTGTTLDWNSPIILFDMANISPAPSNGDPGLFSFVPTGVNAVLPTSGQKYAVAMRVPPVQAGEFAWFFNSVAPASNDARLVPDGFIVKDGSAPWTRTSLSNQLRLEGTI